MSDKLVRVRVQREDDSWSILNGYILLDRRTNFKYHAPRKLEHLLEFPREEWMGYEMRETRETSEAHHKTNRREFRDDTNPNGFSITITLPSDYRSPWKVPRQQVNKSRPFGPMERRWNYCFPQYDRYPEPLMSESFASQRIGKDRWMFAIWHLQTARFKEILKEEIVCWQQDHKRGSVVEQNTALIYNLADIVADYAKDCTLFELEETYYFGIVSMLCELNHFTNFAYQDNQCEYQECFDIFLDILRENPLFCQTLLQSTKNNYTRWGHEMDQIRLHLEDRPEWVQALASVGFVLHNNAKRQRKE